MADYDRLMEPKLWTNVAFVVIGFVVPEVFRRMVETDGTTDLPNEVYGVVSAFGAMSLTKGRTATYLTTGAGMYTVLKLLERFDIIEPVVIQSTG